MRNIFEEGMVAYPEKMKFETEENKKEKYAEIVQQLGELSVSMIQDYKLHDAVCLAKTLTDTLIVMSPEIYEHYRKVEDMLRSVVKKILQKEELATNHFGTIKLVYGNKDHDKRDLYLLGQVLLIASERNYLLAEKYEALGKVLEMR